MRVGVILRYLWIAGAPKIAIYQVKGLIELGYDAELLILAVSPRYKGEYNSLLREVPHIYVHVPKLIEKVELVLNNILFGRWRPGERVIPFSSILFSTKFLKRYYVLLCHDPFSGLVGYLAKLLFKRPYMIYLHETPFGFQPFSFIEKRVLMFADGVIAVTGKVAKETSTLIRREVIPLPPGFPSARHKDFFDKDFVLTVARWDENRRPDWGIEVAERCKHIKFLVLGYWQSESLFEEFAERSKYLKNVSLSKTISEEKLQELLRVTSVVMRFNPRHESGIATIAWEAVHKGVPVIVNSSLGIAEYIRIFNAGIVVDEINAELIEKALIMIKNNYKHYVENCLRLSEYYSSKNCAQNLAKLIRVLVSSARYREQMMSKR